jgi:hypothetical protein
MAERRSSRSVIELGSAPRIVIDALDAAHAEYVVVGSTAAATWGVLRATRDVDLVAIVDTAAAESLLTNVDREDLYVPREDLIDAMRDGGTFNVLHPRSGGEVNVSCNVPTTASLRRAWTVGSAPDVLGVPVWIATAEDLILAKLHWRLDSRSEVQWRDCLEIVATQPLDRSYLGAWAERLGEPTTSPSCSPMTVPPPPD